MKGIALISGVIFTAILVAAIFVAYQMSIPIMENMKSSAEAEQMKNAFSVIDNAIRAVAIEGNGSRRVVPVRLEYGKIIADSGKNTIEYAANLRFPYISPRTHQYIGNLRIGSNLNVSANETTYEGQNVFVIENEHLKIYVRKIGSKSSHQAYSTDQLLYGLYQKDMNAWLDGSLDISIDNNAESKTGSGYTELEALGTDLPYGKVTAFINTTYLNYYIEFILESGTDFIEIRGSYAQ